MKTVILLSGKKGTGKDTAGGMIKRLLYCRNCSGSGKTKKGSNCSRCRGSGSKARTMSFADPLKKFCIDVLGLSEQQCYGQSGERETPTGIKWTDINLKYSKPHSAKWLDGANWDAKLTARDVLQIVGTDVLRNFYQNIWSMAAVNAAKVAPEKVIVFTDTRFPNEIYSFLDSQKAGEMRVIVVRLYRDGADDSHPSETALDSWDEEGVWEHKFNNNLELDDLQYFIETTLAKYGLF